MKEQLDYNKLRIEITHWGGEKFSVEATLSDFEPEAVESSLAALQAVMSLLWSGLRSEELCSSDPNRREWLRDITAA